MPMIEAIRRPVTGCSACAHSMQAVNVARKSCFEYMAELQ
jgi:hypothetical protein